MHLARSVPFLAAVALAMTGCYSMRGSDGGAETDADVERRVDAADVALPPGYRITALATGLTYPTGVAFDGDGVPHVVESGYAYGEDWTEPRLVRIEPDGRTRVVARGARNGPWTGVDFADGAFFVAEGGVLEGGRILRVASDGTTEELVAGLPSFGDHHTNGPRVRDGWIYFGQGTATNSGVVGEDNERFGWVARRPDFHDVLGPGLALADRTFASEALAKRDGESGVETAAFAPLGAASPPDDPRGDEVCSGAILRVRLGGGEPELVAHGLRNPFGLAFDGDGALYATDNGYDDRGSRPVWGAADHLWRIEEGEWYGWPDYSGDLPLTEPDFRPPGGKDLEPLLAEHPGAPPPPAARFACHSSANGLDFSRDEAFGHVGQAFVALFGDQSPATGKTLAPVGFKVVRVDVENGIVRDFAVNEGKENGPATLLGSGGLERPIAVRFDPEGAALYVVDFGVLRETKDGSAPHRGTGVLWRITRDGDAARTETTR